MIAGHNQKKYLNPLRGEAAGLNLSMGFFLEINYALG
jgi:hypothetical protein